MSGARAIQSGTFGIQQLSGAQLRIEPHFGWHNWKTTFENKVYWGRGRLFSYDFEFAAGLLEENEKLERMMTEKMMVLHVGCCINNHFPCTDKRLLADRDEASWLLRNI